MANNNKQLPEISQLHRLQGQLTAVEKMIAENCNCCDIIQQIEAVRGSLRSLEKKLLQKETDKLKNSDLKKSYAYLLKTS